jgi:hypothetical protein
MTKFIFGLLFFLPSLAFSNNELYSSKTIRCRFEKGNSATITERTVKWEIQEVNEVREIIFDAIDLSNNTARAIYKTSSNNIRVYKEQAGLTFIDKSLSYSDNPKEGGFISLFVVSGGVTGEVNFPATESRTWYVSPAFRNPTTIGSQYYGFCKPI